MHTDYDTPRQTEELTESIEVLEKTATDDLNTDVDEDFDSASFELPGADLSDTDLEVVVIPPQENEFTCTSCFLVKHRLQLSSVANMCKDCAG
ncbi:DUF4193 domain-containing protein [Tropheryma whipplei]|uniref:dUTPase n=1 Tax=Tropheryma whipplei (strain Twist) TaxID=203267 RepID=Q83G41_TROWT|nr:DUF4193 domain-containing protein [Tropheryma whipplei]AAO44586.1 unknown [Tropheryma whipplei str. Twist]MCO8182990.1 DUF4193 domain-containing protein [Tropheryma whipplei]MCO8190017.1 DUF4193 domain-containing protein [Tropheryma whipplei]CAD66949.1 conserved hypothetical protein [Tropheryma whipplei TW08/27]